MSYITAEILLLYEFTLLFIKRHANLSNKLPVCSTTVEMQDSWQGQLHDD